MQDYKKLRVWERAHKLTIEIYKATANFPKSEIYGLTSQMRSSSSSILTNIAEGTEGN
jgi:four helix bundle protein